VARATRPALIPLAIAIAGAAIVLYQWMGVRPLWLDEEMIALNFRDRSFAELGGQLWLDQSAPLGWLAAQRLVLLVIGPSELALRAIPALFGVATVFAAFFIGRRWMTTTGCAIFVLLCSLGQWMSFHALELKPYSADTFFGLVLPALAVAAAATSADARRRSLAMWAIAAAIGHWFSLGALLVLPACFVVLAVSERRDRDGIRRLAVAFGVVTASFALHYLLAIRYTQGSASLQDFWQFAMAPRGAGVADSLRWLYGRLEPFAIKPGGTGLAASFWICVALGVVFAPARLLGLATGLVILSGFALALVRIMPLYERLSLWFVPALYLAVGLVADRGVWLVRQRQPMNSAMKLAAACVIFVLVGTVCVDVVESGVKDLRFGRPHDSNRATDDRGALAWLMQQREPGDVLITTHHALPAVWWYGRVPITTEGGGAFPDGGRIFAAEHFPTAPACRGLELETAVDPRHKVLVYFGFVDTRPGFDDLLLERLTRIGTVTALRHFPGASRAAVIDPSFRGGSNLFWEDAGKDTGTWLKGCVAVKPARVW